MIDPHSLQEKLRPRSFVMMILWTAMVLTVLLFVGLAYLINAQQQPVAVQIEVRIAFYAVAGAVAVGSFILRQALLSSPRRRAARVQAEAPRRLDSEAQTDATDAEMPAQLKRAKAIEAKLGALSGRYFTALLLSLALHEAIAMCGMILSINERRFESIIPFAIAAIVLDLLVYPRLGKYVEESTGSAQPF